MIPEQDLSAISRIITERTGLSFPSDKWKELERGITRAQKELGFQEISQLLRKFLNNDLSNYEFNIITEQLTVGETYFFREKPGLELLKSKILPELIAERKETSRSIRIWSAGCCTGEEPYTIAILLNEVLPEPESWNITLLATDISNRFLKKAKNGLYTSWSFRDTPSGYKSRYFIPNGNEMKIHPSVKKMVSFSRINLAEDIFPSAETNTHSMDIVFCRNVLMYFTPEQIARVAGRFYSSLNEKGWLITNPVEISNDLFPLFTYQYIDGTIALRKMSFRSKPQPAAFPAMPAGGLNKISEKARPVAPRKDFPVKRVITVPENPLKDKPKVTADPLKNAQTHYNKKRYSEATILLQEILKKNPENIGTVTLLVKSLANLGDLQTAQKWCDTLIKMNDLSAEAHYLMGTILIEMNETAEAEKSLNKAIYLDPQLLLAYFFLGNVLTRSGKNAMATKKYRQLFDLLSGMSDEEILSESDKMTAGSLKQIVKSLVYS